MTAELASELWSPSLEHVYIICCSFGFSHHHPSNYFPVVFSAWLDSRTHGCWATSCILSEVEDPWEAAAEICLSASHHIKRPDLLPFLTKNVHHHDDKCELWISPDGFELGYNFVITKFFTFSRYMNLSSCQLGRKENISTGPWGGESSLLCFSDLLSALPPLAAGRYEQNSIYTYSLFTTRGVWLDSPHSFVLFSEAVHGSPICPQIYYITEDDIDPPASFSPMLAISVWHQT